MPVSLQNLIPRQDPVPLNSMFFSEPPLQGLVPKGRAPQASEAAPQRKIIPHCLCHHATLQAPMTSSQVC